MEVTFQVGYTEIDARQIPVACLLFFFLVHCYLEKQLYALFYSRLNPLSPGLFFPIIQQCF